MAKKSNMLKEDCIKDLAKDLSHLVRADINSINTKINLLELQYDNAILKDAGMVLTGAALAKMAWNKFSFEVACGTVRRELQTTFR